MEDDSNGLDAWGVLDVLNTWIRCFHVSSIPINSHPDIPGLAQARLELSVFVHLTSSPTSLTAVLAARYNTVLYQHHPIIARRRCGSWSDPWGPRLAVDSTEHLNKRVRTEYTHVHGESGYGGEAGDNTDAGFYLEGPLFRFRVSS